MTFKDWLNNANYEEQRKLAAKLQNWLGYYTQEVIEKVMARIDEIISNDATMKLIDELYERQQSEKEDEIDSFYWTFKRFEEDEKDVYTMHNHCLSHSNSYRDVLYDLYIK